MPRGIYFHKLKPPSRKGAKLSEEQKRRLSEVQKGKNVWSRGKKDSDKTKKLKSVNSARHWLGKKRHNISGEKHYNWKGGITPVILQIRHCFEYRQWRWDIFTRDNFTCVLCGRKREVSGQLEADHFPKRFSEIIEEYQIKTLEEAVKCEELWNINNGRTLCEECHNPTRGMKKKQ